MTVNEADATSLLGLPPTPRQSWSAVVVAACLLVGFGAVLPHAGTPLAELNALFPSLDAIVFVTDLISAVLIFAQFSVVRSRSLLVLASGYLFTALIVVPHALTFTGAFSRTGLLGAGLSTGSWLFIIWHVGFGVALLGYAWQKNRSKAISEASTLPAIGWSVACAFGLMCVLAWLAISGDALLPPIILDKTHISPLVTYYIAFVIAIFLAALAILAVRRRSVLDLWLMVVAFVSILELVFSGLIPTVRFSAGFYAGRVFALVTSSLILIVLLTETTRLYVRLARSNQMLQREQNNKLMTLSAMLASISHELKQPLTAATTNGEAALLLLEQAPPDLEEARAAVSDMVSSGYRIQQILDDIRAVFSKSEQTRELIDVNDAVLGALRLLRNELSDRGVTVAVNLRSELPAITCSRSQLQEVIINLVANAMEAMDAIDAHRRTLAVTTKRHDGNSVVIDVEDSGPGIDPQVSGNLFDAFVTTKPAGTGLGLAICRTIVERHGGQLSARSDGKTGALFRVIFPIATKAAPVTG